MVASAKSVSCLSVVSICPSLETTRLAILPQCWHVPSRFALCVIFLGFSVTVGVFVFMFHKSVITRLTTVLVQGYPELVALP